MDGSHYSKKVKKICERNEIEVPNMDEEINVRGTLDVESKR